MKWHDRIDWEPVIRFSLSAIFICGGYFLFDEGKPGWGTLASALGGAGIARVRSSKPREVEYVDGRGQIYDKLGIEPDDR